MRLPEKLASQGDPSGSREMCKALCRQATWRRSTSGESATLPWVMTASAWASLGHQYYVTLCLLCCNDDDTTVANSTGSSLGAGSSVSPVAISIYIILYYIILILYYIILYYRQRKRREDRKLLKRTWTSGWGPGRGVALVSATTPSYWETTSTYRSCRVWEPLPQILPKLTHLSRPVTNAILNYLKISKMPGRVAFACNPSICEWRRGI